MCKMTERERERERDNPPFVSHQEVVGGLKGVVLHNGVCGKERERERERERECNVSCRRTRKRGREREVGKIKVNYCQS